MTDTLAPPETAIANVVAGARRAYRDGVTRPLLWRRDTLVRLRQLVVAHESALLDALAADFGKPRLEAWAAEVGFVISDIDHVLANLENWARPEKVPTPLALMPGTSEIINEPVGVACVIAPWNYPFQLLVLPMVAAISAGNAVIGKPSELAANTSVATARIFAELGDPAVGIVQGGVTETTELLAQRFDHIFYTGNGRVGRIVMRAAAEHLTPVTLELGGKSPAIVSRKAKIDVAARRIAWGKFLNAGQTCIAPDYVLVERSVHDEFVCALGRSVSEFYGADPSESADFARVVNGPHFHRLEKLLHCGTVAVGGQTDANSRFIAPTVLTGITRDDPIMAEEIFGPILPVIAVDSIDDAIAFVNVDDKPLALYSFSEDHDENRRVVNGTTSGGVCVNGTIMHISSPHLPFGGVGESGIGSYHGRFGFDTFSHRRSVYTRSTRLDPPILYPPYTSGKEKVVRRALLLSDPRDVVAKLRAKVRYRR